MAAIKVVVEKCGLKNSVSLVRLVGEIDAITSSELEDALDSLLKKKRYKIIVELSSVTFISSAGWSVFIARVDECRKNNGDLMLVGMLPEVYESFRLLEFQAILNSYSTVDDAVKAT